MRAFRLTQTLIPFPPRMLAGVAFTVVSVSLGIAQQPAKLFLEKHCMDCHDAESKKGGVDLQSLAWEPGNQQNFEKWVQIHDQVQRGEMPPKKKERPPEEETKTFLHSISKDLTGTDAAKAQAEGRTRIRRLNRNEYERTVQDLLGTSTPLANLLPADTSLYGFDTVGEGLRLSTLQIEKYLEAADVAIKAAIELGAAPEYKENKRWHFKNEDDVRKHLDMAEGTITNPSDPKSKHRHLLRELPDAIVHFEQNYPSAKVRQMERHPEGMFKIRISAYAYQSQGETVSMLVYGDNYKDKQLLGWFEMPPDQPRVVEMVVKLRSGDHLRIEPLNTGRDEKGQNVYNIPVKDFTGAGLALQWAEVEGPLAETTWPPRSLQKLFGHTPVLPVEEGRKDWDKRIKYELKPGDLHANARQVLQNFAERAFRRPLEPGEADRYIRLSTSALDDGWKYLDAMKVGFQAILTSPQFLFLEEQPGSLTEYALASRLSYFFWSSMPDEELLSLAKQGTLSQPENLRAQVERLLKSEKSQAFVQNFTGQWLDLRNIDATSPDSKLYPESDELLRLSMLEETESFFREILTHDLPVTSFIDSDFAMLNSRLAAHYEIEGVSGEQMRRVSLPANSPRGGVLTQASILKITANGTTTSPVLRGSWVLKKILGRPPSPPPPGVGSLEPDTRGATTVREQLALHRKAESCAGCHNKIDPPGFALEAFDVIGGYRERYRSQDKGDVTTVKNSPNKRQYIKLGPPVDASGALTDGRAFSGIIEFKKFLLEDANQVTTALTEKLVIYSTGAGIGFSDRSAVESIVQKTQQKGGGLRTLVHEIVQSQLFQSK